ncbi:MAG TPA: phosphate signaling complex protein PhoU [Acetobacteraceae bacterium]|jgi:phosphate transport system protein|nr:phosphate signaling complex protein PhoU [Acetobacteraceae bacterium]
MSGTGEHIVKSFETELRRLRDLVSEMGGLVENELGLAVEAVVGRNPASATQAMEQEPRVDALEREVEAFVVRLLALRQPMAMDLRQIIAALRMTGDLERIGDYAANVAKRSIVLNQFTLPFSLASIANMARLVQENLKRMIDAIGEMDGEGALRVWRSDQVIDDLYTTIFRELVTYMMEDARSITPCTHLLFVAKNLERIGDHATNIAEVVHFAATGEVLPDERPKGDGSSYAMIRSQE